MIPASGVLVAVSLLLLAFGAGVGASGLVYGSIAASLGAFALLFAAIRRGLPLGDEAATGASADIRSGAGAQPAAAGPVAAVTQQTAARPGPGQPGAGQPGAGQPGPGQPGFAQPGADPSGTGTAAPPAAPVPPPPGPAPAQWSGPPTSVIVLPGTGEFHQPTCLQLASSIGAREVDRGEAVARGYVPCERCG